MATMMTAGDEWLCCWYTWQKVWQRRVMPETAVWSF